MNGILVDVTSNLNGILTVVDSLPNNVLQVVKTVSSDMLAKVIGQVGSYLVNTVKNVCGITGVVYTDIVSSLLSSVTTLITTIHQNINVAVSDVAKLVAQITLYVKQLIHEFQVIVKQILTTATVNTPTTVFEAVASLVAALSTSLSLVLRIVSAITLHFQGAPDQVQKLLSSATFIVTATAQKATTMVNDLNAVLESSAGPTAGLGGHLSVIVGSLGEILVQITPHITSVIRVCSQLGYIVQVPASCIA